MSTQPFNEEESKIQTYIDKIKSLGTGLELKSTSTLDQLKTSPEYRFKLKFENRSTNPDPEYATAGSSAFDLRANLSESMLLHPGSYRLIPTGLYFEIPPNFEIQVRSRSGLAVKFGVAVLNSPGTVDSDYRGECSVILINHGNSAFIINHGDRIAQAVVASVINKNVVDLTKVDKISDNTDRSTNGFGSTGIN